MDIVFHGFVFLLGLCIGSFLNVCIYRLPREMSLLRPGSHCPFCNEPIGWYDNIPVLSWLRLGGLCRRCGVLISPRYVLVELLTGLVFVWVYRAHLTAPADTSLHTVPALGAYLVLSAALIASSFIDIERLVIPDEIAVGGMYVAPLLCLVWPEVIERDALLTRWVLDCVGAGGSEHLAGLTASLIGMGAGAAVVYAAAVFGKLLFRKEAMGFGDVKFMGMVGAFIGWQSVLLAFFAACLLGAVIGLVLLVRRRDTHIPFGPYLALGSLVIMLHREVAVSLLWRGPETIRAWFQ